MYSSMSSLILHASMCARPKICSHWTISNPPTTVFFGPEGRKKGRTLRGYETEFVELVNSAISLVGGDRTKLIVVSIPDYAYTPFGQNSNPTYISEQLVFYNLYAQTYCENNNLNYVYITDITQEGLTNPELIASDNLHPSTLAYTRFVERILPIALDILEQ